MPRLTDGTRRLSEKSACEIAGITPPKRRAWIGRGVLPKVDAKSGLTELQVVELALVELLHRMLGASDAHVVWREIGESVREAVFEDRLDLVVDAGWRSSTLVRTDAELVAAVSSGRSVRVIQLAPLIKETREAFRRIAATSRPPGGEQQGIPSARDQTG
jgi:hypothetical protein